MNKMVGRLERWTFACVVVVAGLGWRSVCGAFALGVLGNSRSTPNPWQKENILARRDHFRTHNRDDCGAFPLLYSSYNPNDQESAEEREHRMEQVRKIQSSFYKPATAPDSSSSASPPGETWSTVDPADPSLIHRLPLWRVQWTEFVGFQNILNVHVPHYTHMFRQLLYQNHPDAWYFGHVYLPGGSENLSHPAYALPTSECSSVREYGSVGEDKVTSPTTSSGTTTSKKSMAATIGTLMRITDFKEEADGRLTLVVQGVCRMQVLQAVQQVPYAIADKARLLADWEASKVSRCHEASVDANDLETRYHVKRAQAIAAVYESQLWRDLEFLSTKLSITNTTRQDGWIPAISPLSNFDGKALAIDRTEQAAKVQRVFDNAIPKDVVRASVTYRQETDVDDEILDLERQVWIEVDRMLQLLESVQPGIRVPMPTQILGLLPSSPNGTTWPPAFKLQAYAEQLDRQGALVGTGSKSPFVWVSRVFPQYPVWRRASRLSFVIWLLIESIGVGNASFDRQAYLETHSLRRRLQKALQHIQPINAVLQEMTR